MTTTDLFRALTALLLLPCASPGAGAKTYPDGRGGEVTLPGGEASFAREVAASPAGGIGRAEAALGPPSYRRIGDGSHLTLGCRGQVTLRLGDVEAADGPGPDLWVFEVGDAPEGTEVWVSPDGTDWRRAGAAAGGISPVDLAPAARPGERYPFVRLVDLGERCDGPWPGADLDAVAAVGPRIGGAVPAAREAPGPTPGRELARTVLRGSVLFDLDRATLRPDAAKGLQGVIRQIREYPGAKIVVEGHTCSLGAARHNRRLSEARAEAIRAFLGREAGVSASTVSCRGYGESRPAAPNTSEEGRRRNRRVEIVFYAPQAGP